MNDNTKTKPTYLRPFRRFCMTIGELPSSYVETMTYYEMLLWFIKYLQETVIPAVNNNAEALEEVQKAIVDLRKYVDDLFDNLDLQEVVDNALDEMIQSGRLAEIIAEFLNSNTIMGFNTLADLKAAENFVDGSFARTLGSSSMKDGNGYLYKIRTKLPTDVPDEINLIELTNFPTLIAERIPEVDIVKANNLNDLATMNLVDGDIVKVMNKYGSDNLSAYFRIYPSDFDDGSDLITLNNGLKAKKLYLKENINEIKVHFPYRGKNTGDSMIIEGTKNIIIDLGSDLGFNTLVNYLIDNNITKIDYLIITHVHTDHIADDEGVQNLVNNPNLDFSHCQFILNTPIEWTRCVGDASLIQSYEDRESNITAIGNTLGGVIYPTSTTKIHIDDDNYLKFYNLTYPANYYTTLINGTTQLNNFSLVTELIHRDKKFLFSGDLERISEDNIINSMDKVDVLKVMHHGVNTNDNIDFINKLNPTYSVIMNTSDTYYQGCYTLLQRLDNTIYTLNESKTIVIETDQDKLKVTSTDGYINDNQGKILQYGDNLNDCKAPGTYRCAIGSGDDNGILNSPFGNTVNFVLEVEAIATTSSDVRVIQTAKANTRYPSIYIRNYSGYGWSDWDLMTDTGLIQVTPTAGLTGNISYRKSGNIVQVVGSLTGVFDSDYFVLNSEAIPVGYRVNQEQWVVGRQASGNVMRFVYFSNNGNITLLEGLGSSSQTIRFTHTYIAHRT